MRRDAARGAGVAPVPIRCAELIARYQGVLLDAYGVLVDESGAIPHAAAFVAALRERGTPHLVVTNDASRSPEEAAARYRELGIEVAAEHVLTSGSLLAEALTASPEPRCLVLGGAQACAQVSRLGGRVVPVAADSAFDIFIACGTRGYEFLPQVDLATSALLRRLESGCEVVLLCPNPDLVYPRARGEVGFTAGAIALLVEAALAQRFPDRELRFTRLGKPYPPILEAAVSRLGTRDLVLIGDQLPTDIAGAAAVGLDSALIATGVTPQPPAPGAHGVTPTYLLSDLELAE